MIKRLAMPLAFLAGLALAAVLAAHAGLAAIGRALADIGWAGVLQVCALQFAALAVCAVAWWAVAPGTRLYPCLMARWIRDGVSNLVGFIPAIGEAVSARALAVFAGSAGGQAAATTIVDVAVESLSQALYTVIGFLLLLQFISPGQAVRWFVVVLIAAVPVVATYAFSRHPGALAWGQRTGLKLARLFGVKEGAGLQIPQMVEAIYGRPRRVAMAFALHMLGWGLGALQTWAAARGLQHPLSFGACVALASLVSAARSAFFLVPWAAGVQEGGFLLVGAAVGLDASSAIALSLVLRARDVLVGAPAILAWYVAEGRRGWARRSAAVSPEA